jgi:hypothetical protein
MQDMKTDALGRRRAPGQERGLRPLFPQLAIGLKSKSVRVAMSDWAWAALDRLTSASHEPTKPRAIGHLLERALQAHEGADWQDWQIRKEKQLLHKAS